jgi:uracil-DNA glycosylase
MFAALPNLELILLVGQYAQKNVLRSGKAGVCEDLWRWRATQRAMTRSPLSHATHTLYNQDRKRPSPIQPDPTSKSIAKKQGYAVRERSKFL